MELNKFSNIFKKEEKSFTFIKETLDRLKIEDEIGILNTLYELSSTLSMSNDNIAEDPNCVNLIKEIVTVLDKSLYMPELGIAALLCLNNLLDINPRFHSAIVKFGGISKIVMMTQNIEFIDLAENAMKCIEKLCLECPYVVLENEGFSAILSLIEFFDYNLRKSAIISCYHMSKCITGYNMLKKNIIPSIPNINSLIKINDSLEISKVIQEYALLTFLNILASIKVNNNNELCKALVNNILSFGIIDNIMNIFLNSNKFENKNLNINGIDSIYVNEDKNTSNHNNQSTKIIIQIFDLLCFLSNEATDLLLNMNILEDIYFILVSNTKKGVNQNIYADIFNLLINLFPYEKIAKEKLAASYNAHFYKYFSQNILIYVIDNIINIPAINSLIQIIKLLKNFIMHSDESDILAYINPFKLANICFKMLDSKDAHYILEVLDLVDSILKKVSSKFTIAFIREGVSNQLVLLSSVDSKDIYNSQGFDKHYLGNEISKLQAYNKGKSTTPVPFNLDQAKKPPTNFSNSLFPNNYEEEEGDGQDIDFIGKFLFRIIIYTRKY